MPVFAEMRRTRVGSSPSRSATSTRGAVRVGLRQVDLVHDGDDLEPVLDREIRVRERLRLDPLRRVDDEERALARLERARDLVGEVDVARRVDQVELVALPRDAHGLRLDRDAALALEIHRVEQLGAHVALDDRLGDLEDAVGERRLAVVDVRDDREVADLALVHGLSAMVLGRAGFSSCSRRDQARRRRDAQREQRRPAPAPGATGSRRGRRATDAASASAERDDLRRERAAERGVERMPDAPGDRGDDAGRDARPGSTVARSRAPSSRPSRRRRRTSSAHVPGDVADRGRERDAPRADAVEARSRGSRSGTRLPSATAVGHPVRLQAEERAVQHQHRAVEDEPRAERGERGGDDRASAAG